jgi:very-short-patch-repair endonuclease
MYLDGRTTPDLLDRIHAALAVCPPDAVLGFHTAAALWGFGVIATDSVHVVVPLATRYPQRRGIVAHQSVLPMETTRILGAPCLPAARCAIDLARTLSRRDALPVLDAALYAQVCDHSDLLAELKLHDGLRGVRQARELVALADPRAQCKQESQLRLIIHDAGLVGFEPQLPVFGTNGNPRYYLDLGNPHTKVAAEYDGSSHLDRARLQSDRSRHNWLETQGWHLRYFTARDLYTTPHTIPPTLAAPSSPPPATRRR